MNDSDPLHLAWRRFLASWLDWLGSRKTKTLLLTSALALLAWRLGLNVDAVLGFLGLGSAGVVGQGMADIKSGGSRAR